MTSLIPGQDLPPTSLGSDQMALLSNHGLRRGAATWETIVPGHGGQQRNSPRLLVENRGFMKAPDIVECQICLDSKLNRWLQLGPHRDWYDGHTARERHWHVDRRDPSKTVGLRLNCFYSVYMDLLREAERIHSAGDPRDSELARRGRMALVSVSMKDMLRIDCGGPSSGSRRTSNFLQVGVSLKVSRLKVIDLIDQLPLIPSHAVVLRVLGASKRWHEGWHPVFDNGMQGMRWPEFPARISDLLGRVTGW